MNDAACREHRAGYSPSGPSKRVGGRRAGAPLTDSCCGSEVRSEDDWSESEGLQEGLQRAVVNRGKRRAGERKEGGEEARRGGDELRWSKQVRAATDMQCARRPEAPEVR